MKHKQQKGSKKEALFSYKLTLFKLQTLKYLLYFNGNYESLFTKIYRANIVPVLNFKHYAIG